MTESTLNKHLLLPLLMLTLQSCGDASYSITSGNNINNPNEQSEQDDENSSSENDDSGSCQGFDSPHINVFVQDSTSKETVLNDAVVNIVMSDEQQSKNEQAIYIAEEDKNEQTLQGAWYAPLSLNSDEFEVAITVFNEGYHANVTMGIQFATDTQCNADNGLTVTVYLCPLGTDCL